MRIIFLFFITEGDKPNCYKASRMTTKVKQFTQNQYSKKMLYVSAYGSAYAFAVCNRK